MMLTNEITNLLDKLYNLRGEDSVVLKEMEKERVAAEETKERTSNELVALQAKINELSKEESELANQGSKLMDALSGIDSAEFSFVLERLNIDFNPEELRNKLSAKLPETIDKVVNETKKAESELVSVEEEMNTAITTIEELGIRKDAALSNQAKLNEYFELALNGNINITRDSITSLLEQFDFSEEEQREAAKIMMFPEDALYDYDARIREAESSGKSISEVIAEARDYTKTLTDDLEISTPVIEERNPIEVNAPVYEEYVREEVVEPQVQEYTEYQTVEPVYQEVEPQPEEPVVVDPKEALKALMADCGLDYLDFTNSDLDQIIANYAEDVLRKNVELAKKNNMDLDIFTDNIALLYDKELEDKINRLISVGKAPLDIYLNPNVLLKYDFAGLNNTINLLQINGLDPRKVPLMAY